MIYWYLWAHRRLLSPRYLVYTSRPVLPRQTIVCCYTPARHLISSESSSLFSSWQCPLGESLHHPEAGYLITKNSRDGYLEAWEINTIQRLTTPGSHPISILLSVSTHLILTNSTEIIFCSKTNPLQKHVASCKLAKKCHRGTCKKDAQSFNRTPYRLIPEELSRIPEAVFLC